MKKTTIMTYTSTGLAFAAVLLFLSGLALYCAPTCRVARDIGWSFLFLGKESWETIHMTFALLLILLSIFHLYLNWNRFSSYFTQGSDGSSGGGRILFLIAIAAVVLILMSAFKIPPVGWLLESHDSLKSSWGSSRGPEGKRDGRGRGDSRGRFRGESPSSGSGW